ncbi:hypothetical protein BaRGS_00014879 [Batillaria attramentaria]|uniref:Uncharacterized protein n=1 Tax=Batillaria attramentaria TaxID=370345 RepID=A0ABD0L3K3_9CAEN
MQFTVPLILSKLPQVTSHVLLLFVCRLYQPASRRPVAFSPSAEMGLTDIEMAHNLDLDDPFFDDRQYEMVYEAEKIALWAAGDDASCAHQASPVIVMADFLSPSPSWVTAMNTDNLPYATKASSFVHLKAFFLF